MSTISRTVVICADSRENLSRRHETRFINAMCTCWKCLTLSSCEAANSVTDCVNSGFTIQLRERDGRKRWIKRDGGKKEGKTTQSTPQSQAFSRPLSVCGQVTIETENYGTLLWWVGRGKQRGSSCPPFSFPCLSFSVYFLTGGGFF